MRLVILTLLTLILIALFIRLGFWQLQRYDEKKSIVNNEQSLKQLPALSQLPIDATNLKSLKYHPVQFQGKFLAINYLLDNRHYQHQIGYEVLTPFEIYPSKNFIMVNRGWISREQASSLKSQLHSQMIKIDGILYLPTDKPFILKAEHIDSEQNNQVIQSINLNQISESLNHPLYPMVILLNKNAPHGFIRDWKLVNTRPEKSLGYALQWFSFALVLILIYGILLVKFYFRRKNK